MEDTIRPLFFFIVENTEKKGKFKKDKMKNVDMVFSSLGEIKMDRSSGLGLPTHLPSHHGSFMTVVLQVFVPVTAAGQRGLFTPLPHIHLFCLFTGGEV
jgi:hypothetical protein